MLGASRRRAFREVTLPLLGPPIAAAASIVFLFTFTAFGVVLLLADPAHTTLEVEIYRQAVDLFDLPIAAALALVQMVAVVTLLVVLSRMQERRAVSPTPRRGARRGSAAAGK
jgi:thiamine transport system permease protein